MNEQEQAQRLAAWLEGPAGGDPPEGLDAEVLAAVSLLRPDRAPAPRVSLDDILGAVKEGPFATAAGSPPLQTAVSMTEFPEERGTLTAFPTRPAPPRVASEPVGRGGGSRRPAWLYPFIGVAFAAAAASAIVLPLIGDQVTDKMSHVALEGSPAPSMASAPPPPPAAPLSEQTVAEAAPSAELGAMDKSVELPAAQVAGSAGEPPGVTTLDMLPAEERQARVTADGAGSAGPVVGGAIAEMSTESRREAPADDWGGVATTPEATAAPAAPPSPASSAGYGGDNDLADEEVANLDQAVSGKAEKESSRKKDAENKPKTANEADAGLAEDEPAIAEASVVKTPAASRAYAPATGTVATTSATTTSALSSRATAVPLDYNPGWYRAYPDIVPIYDAAAQDEAQARFAEAITRYRALYTDGRVDVAQDASWRGARDQMSQGDLSGALATVESGLRRGGGTSVYRVHLLVLKGDILNAQGRSADAARAWSEAAGINRGR